MRFLIDTRNLLLRQEEERPTFRDQRKISKTRAFRNQNLIVFPNNFPSFFPFSDKSNFLGSSKELDFPFCRNFLQSQHTWESCLFAINCAGGKGRIFAAAILKLCT